MSRRKRRLAKFFGLPALAAFGFLVAATVAGVGLADITTSTGTTSTITTTTTPPPPPPPPPPTTTTPVGEGCTPGYWKNHPESWPATGFSTGQTLESVFDVPDGLGLDSKTLLAAAQTGGGGVDALLRHAVAALLNSAHPSVDYDLTTSAVISMVNAALASGNADTIESLKDSLAEFNEQSAPGFCD